MSKSLDAQKSHQNDLFVRHKKEVVVFCSIIVLIIIFMAPIVPVKSIETKTRNVNLTYDSGAYGRSGIIADYISVTNTDSVGGTFSVTMNWYELKITGSSLSDFASEELKETTTQSSVIKSGATQTFSIPEDWIIFGSMYSFKYSVMPPTKQQDYNVTKTEYTSIVDLIVNS